MGAEAEPNEALPGIWLARPHPIPTGGGIPLAVKDLLDTAGLTTTYGSILFADHVPDRTAEAVFRLERAGYRNVGKTNLHEFAYGVTSQNPHFGTVPNPIAPGRIAGGSSGGSAAALAAGLADAALGTDSGGSIRIPAACCGVVGFKPTYGLVPLAGCFPLAPTFDHAGPMARSVADCAAMMEALAGGFDRTGAPTLGDLRVGVAWLDRCDPLVRTRLGEAAALFPGARPVDLPLVEGIAAAFMREVADVHRDLFAESADAYGANVRAKLELCLAVTDAEAAEAARRREDYREAAGRALGDLDLLLTPTLAFVAPPLPDDELTVRDELIQFTYPFNALGWPALALPAGPAEDGLPASLQLVGRPGDDALVLAAGEALEVVLGASGRPREGRQAAGAQDSA
jgi:aspartyl-tRNA(Asn)/glutamyl-tRNA(Gln) amidotransferase subunit A